jgi:hypothetical protein
MEVKALENRPILNRWVTDYWEAFQLCSSSRAITQGGIGPIPLSEIVAYLNASYIRDVEERLRTIKMIQCLDRVYVSHVNEKVKRDADLERQKARRGKR